MTLNTVGDFVRRARVLLQDEIAPYRYETPELIEALNEASLEARRLRPDFFLRTFNTATPKTYTSEADTVTIPEEYRTAFVYYIVGNAHLRDEEDTQDQRASVFLNKFVAQLTTFPS